MVNGEISMLINSDLDVVNAREKGRRFAEGIGFRGSELTLLSTLISELARKVVSFDCRGNVVIQSIQIGTRKGIAISVSENLFDSYRDSRRENSAGKDGLSRDGRLLLLAGRHVADEFEIRPISQRGAVVKVVKWL